MVQSKEYYRSIIEGSNALNVLMPFGALWVGSIPIDVHIASSDIDIICIFQDDLNEVLTSNFGQEKDFSLRTDARKLIANFTFNDVPFEIYAERTEPVKQLAYLHMLAEAYLLRIHGEPLRKEVRSLKEQGLKTEPAFAKALDIDGDPYQELLRFVDYGSKA